MMDDREKICLISQGLILDHYGYLYFSLSTAKDPEAFAKFFTERLEGVPLFEWVKEKPRWSLVLEGMYAFTTKHLTAANAIDHEQKVTVTDSDQSCKWPGCEKDEVDKDHILPNSGLRADFTPFENHFKEKFGEGWNGQYLCQHHNRRVKLNSIGIGLAFLMLRECG